MQAQQDQGLLNQQREQQQAKFGSTPPRAMSLSSELRPADDFELVWTAYREGFQHAEATMLPSTFDPESIRGGLWYQYRDIGVCGMHNINWVDRVVQPFVWIKPELRGGKHGLRMSHALMDLAFNNLGIRRAETTLLETAISIPILKYLGFVEEGRKHAVRMVDGKYVDAIMYAYVKE